MVVGQELSGYPVYGRAGELALGIIIVSGVYNLGPWEGTGGLAYWRLEGCIVGEETS